jgi:hypothetical protein
MTQQRALPQLLDGGGQRGRERRAPQHERERRAVVVGRGVEVRRIAGEGVAHLHELRWGPRGGAVDVGHEHMLMDGVVGIAQGGVEQVLVVGHLEVPHHRELPPGQVHPLLEVVVVPQPACDGAEVRVLPAVEGGRGHLIVHRRICHRTGT